MCPNVCQQLRVVGIEAGGFFREVTGKTILVCVILQDTQIYDFQVGVSTR